LAQKFPDFQFIHPAAFAPKASEALDKYDLVTPDSLIGGKLHVRRAGAGDLFAPIYIMERQGGVSQIACCQIRMVLNDKAPTPELAGGVLWLGDEGAMVARNVAPSSGGRAVGVVLADGSWFFDGTGSTVVPACAKPKSPSKTKSRAKRGTSSSES
tara:strand:+ start:1271 stop:1738 length:468 start_codon:yes stop_codon:yes gene_type:complete